MLTLDEFKDVFDASPDGILVVTRDGSIHAANRKVEQMFGLTSEELKGMSVDGLLPDALRGAHRRHREGFMKHPRERAMGVGLELHAQRKDGTDFPVEVSLSPWHTEDGAPGVICGIRDITERRRIRDFTEGALRASEQERSRISHELHDDTAQRLATLLLRLRVLAGEKDEVARTALCHDLREEIVATADSVRRMARGLRPPELEQLGLSAALHAHARRSSEHEEFRLDLRIDPVDSMLDTTQQLVLYRIIQEATNNARQHSGASSAQLTITLEEEVLSVTVRDEGSGFDPNSGLGDGLGLIGMRERAAMIGGGLTVASTPGSGTSITVRLRLPHEEPQDV